MAQRLNRLTALEIRNAHKKGMLGDGGGLWLQISAFKTKSWVFLYQSRGKRHYVGLGALNDVSLAEARKIAHECRRLIREGKDPLREMRSRKRAVTDGITFAEAARRYIELREPTWRGRKHSAQWRSTLETYAFPTIGDLQVNEIETKDVSALLEPIWNEKRETATRLRGRIESVLGWAITQGFRDRANPATWKNHLENVFPGKSRVHAKKHFEAIDYRELGAFISKLRSRKAIAARALEFLILTATRTSEVTDARWNEFDLENGLWEIPKERMKAGRAHRVPLGSRALQILKVFQTDSPEDFVFPGGKKGKPLSNGGMIRLLQKRMGYRTATVHGFRSSFSVWAAENGYPEEVREEALAHVLQGVAAAYRRTDLFLPRKKMMTDWEKFLNVPSKPRGKVLPLQREIGHG